MKSILLCALWAGCSSTSSGRADLSPGCSEVLTGDATANESCTHADLCHPTSNDYEAISLVSATMHSLIEVDGVFTVRDYAFADFKSIDVVAGGNGKQYGANQQLAGSTAAMTLTALVKPTTNPCDGSASGSLTATLVEFDVMTGMAMGTGRAMLTINF